MCQVGSQSLEILTNCGFELFECARLNIQLPLKLGAHLLMDLVERAEAHAMQLGRDLGCCRVP